MLEEPKKAANVTEYTKKRVKKVKIDSKNKEAVKQGEEEPEILIPLPFLQRALQSNKLAGKVQEKDILETLRKFEINFPLFDAIKQIPKYDKFLKELYTNKRRLRGTERVSLNQNVSALLQPMPHKCKDPETFSIPCIIGNYRFDNCMADLGASINVMPAYVYNSLGLGPLRPTGVLVQLANRSNAYPAGLIEDVLIKVNELIFPADFTF